MSKLVYQVVKETPGYQIGSYSDMETMSEHTSPEEALQEAWDLGKLCDEGEYYFVRLVRG